MNFSTADRPHVVSSAARRSLAVEVRPDLDRAYVRALATRVVDALGFATYSEILVDVRSVRSPDAAHIEALARLQLAARHHGVAIELVGPCPDLIELLSFVGLSDVIDPETSGNSDQSGGIELHRQAEHGE